MGLETNITLGLYPLVLYPMSEPHGFISDMLIQSMKYWTLDIKPYILH